MKFGYREGKSDHANKDDPNATKNYNPNRDSFNEANKEGYEAGYTDGYNGNPKDLLGEEEEPDPEEPDPDNPNPGPSNPDDNEPNLGSGYDEAMKKIEDYKKNTGKNCLAWLAFKTYDEVNEVNLNIGDEYEEGLKLGEELIVQHMPNVVCVHESSVSGLGSDVLNTILDIDTDGTIKVSNGNKKDIIVDSRKV